MAHQMIPPSTASAATGTATLMPTFAPIPKPLDDVSTTGAALETVDAVVVVICEGSLHVVVSGGLGVDEMRNDDGRSVFRWFI